MTNRERAWELIPSSLIIDAVERALDEAEKRGFDIGYENGERQGQKEMRERIAKEMELHERMKKLDWPKTIRALPIDGE